MKSNRNSHLLLIIKILLIGSLIAGLIYLFHPAVGQFNLIINGQPIAEPLARLAVIPTLLIVIFFTVLLMIIVFFGLGFMLFTGALLFAILGLFVVAPYAWPVLLLVFLLIALMSISKNKGEA